MEQVTTEPMTTTLRDRVLLIDDGKYADLVKNMQLDENCMKCGKFNMGVQGGYRCGVAPVCPGVTLHPGLLSHFNWSLGLISKEVHVMNLGKVWR